MALSFYALIVPSFNSLQTCRRKSFEALIINLHMKLHLENCSGIVLTGLRITKIQFSPPLCSQSWKFTNLFCPELNCCFFPFHFQISVIQGEL